MMLVFFNDPYFKGVDKVIGFKNISSSPGLVVLKARMWIFIAFKLIKNWYYFCRLIEMGYCGSRK